jgi:outer membrane protein OmpA-like peptidoglycan-associated protein
MMEAPSRSTAHEDETMKTTRLMICCLLAAGFAAPVGAQEGAVLQGEAITESALIEALTPAPAPVLTRGIDQKAPAPAPKPTKAALLITFETNATVLTPAARRELDVVGRALNTRQLSDFKFMIEGHADPRGTSERNQKLSEGRAEAVRRYLIQSQGVREDRLKAVGKGDREPLKPGDPAAPENRRVTFVNLSR